MPASDTVQRAALLPSDAIGASSTSELQVTKGGVLVTCPFEGSNQYNKRPCLLKTWGRTTTVGASNLTVKFYYGISTTIGSNFVLASSGAVAAGSGVSSNFYLEVRCLLDSTSKIINPELLPGHIGATLVAAAFGTQVTAVDPSVEALAQAFSLTIQLSASNAGNLVIVDGFEFEAR